MKKSLQFVSSAALLLASFVPVFAQEGPINVISREDGSGTRGAFVEIVGVVDENGDDMTSQAASIQNSTNGVMTTVAGDPASIGYISLGSLDDSVKAVKVDGVEATAENIKAGDYAIARPFNVAWKKDGEMSDVATDFLSYIHSADGQAIVEEEGYISSAGVNEEEEAGSEEAASEEGSEAAGSEEAASEEGSEETASEEAASEESSEEATSEAGSEEAGAELAAYEAKEGLKGDIEVVGSTSVTPLMEKLAEEYMGLNPDVKINITSNGSSAGMEAAMEGTADLGMASRELSDEEKEALEFDAIAIDGIAVVVNKENAVEDLKLEAIKNIFLGDVADWAEAVK
ncbi:substrate-binding domain-containing protein [Eremococcus coleocola]|uniref:Putative Phosphate-binding protein PstS 2 n=1 Tax=Eremococcus coleocola ACS-139-V-Col8 TaxID=908337 RepID=E4KMW8_9LACT|nr:substrate-binding domain-containing protein [Eremococcus coleocola]EFR31748.1 putative Phosphate-binding protein PstS 2 [Eremococcus coleocola ACS-139-V-Col8]